MRVGVISMITLISERSPSGPVFCLFEYLFSAFLDPCLLSFDVIMINNELCPLCYLIAVLEGLEASFPLLFPAGPL